MFADGCTFLRLKMSLVDSHMRLRLWGNPREYFVGGRELNIIFEIFKHFLNLSLPATEKYGPQYSVEISTFNYYIEISHFLEISG